MMPEAVFFVLMMALFSVPERRCGLFGSISVPDRIAGTADGTDFTAAVWFRDRVRAVILANCGGADAAEG